MKADGGNIYDEIDPLQKAKDDYFFSKDFDRDEYEKAFGHEDLVKQGTQDRRARDAWIQSRNTLSDYQNDPSAFADKNGLYNPLAELRNGTYQRSMDEIHGSGSHSAEDALKAKNEVNYIRGMSPEAQLARMRRDQQQAAIRKANPQSQQDFWNKQKNKATELKTAQESDNQTRKGLSDQFHQNEFDRRNTVRDVMDQFYGTQLEKAEQAAMKRQNETAVNMIRLKNREYRDENGNWHDKDPSWGEQVLKVADDATGNVGSSLYNMGKAWSKGDVGGGFMNLLGAGTGLMSMATPLGIATTGAQALTKHAGAPEWLSNVVQTIGSAKNPMGAAVNLGMQYGIPEVLKATGVIPSSPSVPAQKKGGKIPSHHVYGYRKEKNHNQQESKKTTNRTFNKRKT